MFTTGPACPRAHVLPVVWHKCLCPPRTLAERGPSSPSSRPAALWGGPGLTFAGLPVAAQAESGAAPAGSGLVAVPEEADVRAAPRLAELIRLAGMAPHCNRERGLQQPQATRAAQRWPAWLQVPTSQEAQAGRGHYSATTGMRRWSHGCFRGTPSSRSSRPARH